MSSFVEHIFQFVKWVNKNVISPLNKLVLEIGSNDGTCLKEFKKIGCKVSHVDPII